MVAITPVNHISRDKTVTDQRTVYPEFCTESWSLSPIV